MSKKFNLSEKVGYHNNYESSAFITKENVKEFIKLLKEEIEEINDNTTLTTKGIKKFLQLHIDKLSGDLK